MTITIIISFIKSLDSQSLSPLDKEKSVETEIFRLPQELNDKIFQLAEDRSQGLLIKLQQYFFTNKVYGFNSSKLVLF